MSSNNELKFFFTIFKVFSNFLIVCCKIFKKNINFFSGKINFYHVQVTLYFYQKKNIQLFEGKRKEISEVGEILHSFSLERFTKFTFFFEKKHIEKFSFDSSYWLSIFSYFNNILVLRLFSHFATQSKLLIRTLFFFVVYHSRHRHDGVEITFSLEKIYSAQSVENDTKKCRGDSWTVRPAAAKVFSLNSGQFISSLYSHSNIFHLTFSHDNDKTFKGKKLTYVRLTFSCVRLFNFPIYTE